MKVKETVKIIGSKDSEQIGFKVFKELILINSESYGEKRERT